MEAVLLVVHLMLAIGIIGVVLLQPSESGGFMGSGGSMSNLGAPRRSADVLTRTTAVLVACFFTTSLLLAMAAGNNSKPKSILDLASEGDKAPITAPLAAETPADKADKKAPAPKPAAEKQKQQPKAPVSK